MNFDGDDDRDKPEVGGQPDVPSYDATFAEIADTLIEGKEFDAGRMRFRVKYIDFGSVGDLPNEPLLVHFSHNCDALERWTMAGCGAEKAQAIPWQYIHRTPDGQYRNRGERAMIEKMRAARCYGVWKMGLYRDPESKNLAEDIAGVKDAALLCAVMLERVR